MAQRALRAVAENGVGPSPGIDSPPTIRLVLDLLGPGKNYHPTSTSTSDCFANLAPVLPGCPALTATLPQSMTLEMSAFVESGSGGSWVVEMFDGSADKYATIGDFSSAGGDWTLVSLTVTSDDLPKYYLDTNVDSEVLVRVTSDSVGSLQARRTLEMPVDERANLLSVPVCVCITGATTRLHGR